MEQLPRFSTDLVDQLDAQFPEQCPYATWTDRQIWLAAGAREVVRFLRRLQEEDKNGISELASRKE